MKYLILCSFILLISSCIRQKVKKNACNGTMNVLTSAYNSDSVQFYIPNVFTPNGDGINDVFKVVGSGFEAIEMKIYKGNKLVLEQTFQPGYGWNGDYKGRLSKSFMYKYEISLTTIHNEIIEIEGDISIIDPLEDKGFINCSSCIFGDMIDPRVGIIHSTHDVLDCD